MGESSFVQWELASSMASPFTLSRKKQKKGHPGRLRQEGSRKNTVSNERQFFSTKGLLGLCLF